MEPKENNKEEYVERLLLEAARRGAEERLRRTVADSYSAWAAHRREVRRDRRIYTIAACVALLLTVPAGKATAQQLPSCNITVNHIADLTLLSDASDQIVAAL